MLYGITNEEAKELDCAELQAKLSDMIIQLQYEEMQARRLNATRESIENLSAEIARRKGE